MRNRKTLRRQKFIRNNSSDDAEEHFLGFDDNRNAVYAHDSVTGSTLHLDAQDADLYNKYYRGNEPFSRRHANWNNGARPVQSSRSLVVKPGETVPEWRDIAHLREKVGVGANYDPGEYHLKMTRTEFVELLPIANRQPLWFLEEYGPVGVFELVLHAYDEGLQELVKRPFSRKGLHKMLKQINQHTHQEDLKRGNLNLHQSVKVRRRTRTSSKYDPTTGAWTHSYVNWHLLRTKEEYHRAGKIFGNCAGWDRWYGRPDFPSETRGEDARIYVGQREDKPYMLYMAQFDRNSPYPVDMEVLDTRTDSCAVQVHDGQRHTQSIVNLGRALENDQWRNNPFEFSQPEEG